MEKVLTDAPKNYGNLYINNDVYKEYAIFNESYERNHINILENQSVAFIEEKENIEILIQTILQNIYTGKIKDNNITIDLNNIINAPIIKFTEQFLINIVLTNRHIVTAMYLPSMLKINKDTGYVKSVMIRIKIPMQYEQYVEYQLRRLLYHELSHCKEDIERVLNNKESITDAYQSSAAYINYDKVISVCNIGNSAENNDLQIIANVLYRLFVSTERHALQNELYADLKSIKSLVTDLDRTTIKTYMFNETEVGKTYIWLKNEIYPECKKDNEFALLSKQFFNDSFLKKFKSDNSFYNWFINQFERSLQQLFNKICKISELFLLYEGVIPEHTIHKATLIRMISEDTAVNINEQVNPFAGDNILYNTYEVTYSVKGISNNITVSISKLLLTTAI